MVNVDTLYPFRDAEGVIRHYIHNRRGRQRGIDILENEIRPSPERVDVRWELCCFAVSRALKHLDLSRKRAFHLRYGVDHPDCFSLGDIEAKIGEILSRTPRTIRYWLEAIRDDIETEAEELELIAPVEQDHARD